MSIPETIDLPGVLCKMPAARYDPARFPGMMVNLQNPKSTVLLFGSGKIISTGTKSIAQTKMTLTAILEILQRLGYRTGKTRIRIENIVASVSYGRCIDLERCAQVLPKSMYEPEQFPAVFHRMGDPPATTLIYKTGRLICTGLNTQHKVFAAASKMNRLLAQHDLFC